MVEREVDAEAHDGAREEQHDEQDGRIKAGDLCRDLHAPERAPAVEALPEALTP